MTSLLLTVAQIETMAAGNEDGNRQYQQDQAKSIESWVQLTVEYPGRREQAAQQPREE